MRLRQRVNELGSIGGWCWNQVSPQNNCQYGFLDPAPHHVLVGQGKRMLQVRQARGEPGGGGGTAARGREMPGPFALEDAPVDVGGQFGQRMLQVD